MPSELHGAPVVGITCCYAGDLVEGARRSCVRSGSSERPVLDLCQPKPYLEHQSMFDASFPHGWWYYLRACDVAELSDEVIDITVEHANRIGSPLTAFPIWQLGGAVARVRGRGDGVQRTECRAHLQLSTTCDGPEGFEAERQWSRDFLAALEPHQTSVYVNFLLEEGQERVREAYGAEKYDRLQALKRKYDPDNLFRLNQNIRP